jgi:hypothetical protein
MKNFQAIYQINHDGVWMDYVRLGVRQPDDCISHARLLERENGKPFRVRVEDWSDRNAHPDVYYGDWDKAMLSPAAQSTGVFKPLS